MQRMETHDQTVYTVGYEAGQFRLLAPGNIEGHVLEAGDTLDLVAFERRQAVRVASGGAGGWYSVASDGGRARFAIGMRACNYQAGEPNGLPYGQKER